MAVSRATIPEEFLDITSADLLSQPEPQYFHGLMLLSAMNAQLDAGEPIGLPIPDRQFGASGPSYGDLLGDRLNLSDPIMSGAIKVVAELGKPLIGHTIRINRPKFIDSTYTQAARRVPVGTTIGTSPIDIQSEQTQITIDRFAGPYDTANSRVAPYAFERFDAMRMLHSAAAIKEFHLKRDFHKTIDAFGVLLFDQADVVIYPTGMTADNDSVTVGDFPFSLEQLARVQQSLEEAYIPKFPNGRYVAILTPKQEKDLVMDDDYGRNAQYFEQFNILFRQSYIKSVGAFDLFRSSTLRRVANGNTPAIPIQYGQAFGPGAVGCGIGEMPRIATNTQDNYGETAMLIWLMYAGFQVLDSRFIRSVRSS